MDGRWADGSHMAGWGWFRVAGKKMRLGSCGVECSVEKDLKSKPSFSSCRGFTTY